MNNNLCIGIFIITLLFFGIIYYYIITRKYIYYENMVSSAYPDPDPIVYEHCNEMSDCKTCVTNNTPDGICYWCKNKCVNPDDYYDPASCSRDPAKCTANAVAVAPITASNK